MQIQQLEYFVAVSEHLNFTKAAKQFFISQTAVTQQIKALEQELGVQLFFRNNRRVELTPAGKTFLEDAKAILRRTRDAMYRAKQANTVFTGNLNIGFVKGFEKTCLSDLLSDFHSLYPNISFTLSRENVGELYDSLLDRNLDIVINLQFSMANLKDIDYCVIRQYPLLAVMPTSHPLAYRSVIRRSDLKGYPLIDIHKGENRYEQTTIILQAFTNAGFLPDVAYTSDDIETSILAVAAGFGYALLPSYITDALSMKEKVIAVPIEGEEKLMTVIAAWHKDNPNPALERFRKDCIMPAIEHGRF